MNRKLSKSKISCFVILFVLLISAFPSSIVSWKQETSNNLENPRFTTHQWLAYEALKLSPSSSKIQWITNNLLDFWLGVEAPYNSEAALELGLSESDYGDISTKILYLNAGGTIVTNDSLAERAQDEYDKLVVELGKTDTDHKLAAFYAGAMSHYISQAGIWAAIWNETLWGTLDVSVWFDFEQQIDYGLVASYFDYDQSYWNNSYFSLSPSIIASANASTSAINLAKTIHPYAEDMGNNFDEFWFGVNDWSTSYKDNVTFCLNASVEAIYSAINHALESVNWKYLSIEDPQFVYNNETGNLEIPEFSVNYTDNTGSYTLTDSLATQAEFGIIVDPNGDATVQETLTPLQYNGVTDKWYHENHLLYGSVAYSEHTIFYQFKMDGSTLTFSNISSDIFTVNYFNFTFDDFNVYYDSQERIVSIWNISCSIPDIPEIGLLNESEVDSAGWILYQKATGPYTGEPIGIAVLDTEGNNVEGELTYNSTYDTWNSYDNDIGLVFTPTDVECYVVVRFEINDIPVGYFSDTLWGTVFKPYIQKSDNNFFITRDHIITISIPQIEFDEENKVLSISEITAYADYNNTFLDYYEIIEKDVFGPDQREARWKIFMKGGISSSFTNDLLWDNINQWWYSDYVDVSNLPDGKYFVAAKIVNMNTNFTASPWGPSSNIFTITGGPTPIYIFILPVIFLSGFVAIPGTIFGIITRKK
ncbi:MAG: hypothetical protein FK733_16755 [Asgard group archaeon]|nr:hypothetical protein [Asgard group archaeon]